MLDKILRRSDIESYETVGELSHFEMLRSRRYQRPLSVLALIAVNSKRVFSEADISDLSEHTRRIDIFETSDIANGVIHLICPETNARGAVSLTSRLRAIPALSDCKLGYSTFPDDGSSIELLLETARDRAVLSDQASETKEVNDDPQGADAVVRDK